MPRRPSLHFQYIQIQPHHKPLGYKSINFNNEMNMLRSMGGAFVVEWMEVAGRCGTSCCMSPKVKPLNAHRRRVSIEESRHENGCGNLLEICESCDAVFGTNGIYGMCGSRSVV